MNALIDQLTTLRLHGMATCAQDLLASRKPSRCPAGGFAAEREPYNCAQAIDRR